ncbi:MAG TPA: GNAT family N-acetyltransferase [Capsulimonadaceae bacterium]|jgi:RimJ/RimL family protein N-acetyltransferase
MTPAIASLETPRLTLRPLRFEDATRIQELFPHPEIVKYLDVVVPWPYPADGAAQFLARVLPEVDTGVRYSWAITETAAADDALIGLIELTPNNPNDHRGFWLGLPYHGRGYMSEAATAVTDYAFDILQMPELLLSNAEPNIASHRLKEKAGATIVSIIDDVAFVGGHFRKVSWRLTPAAWASHRCSASRHSLNPSRSDH